MKISVGYKSGNLVKLERTGTKALPADVPVFKHIYSVEIENSNGNIERLENIGADEICFINGIFTCLC